MQKSEQSSWKVNAALALVALMFFTAHVLPYLLPRRVFREPLVFPSAAPIIIEPASVLLFQKEPYAGKVVVVDLWQTTCDSCLTLIPHLADLYERRRKEGLEVVGIAYDGHGPGAEQQVGLVASQLEIPYRLALGGDWEEMPEIVKLLPELESQKQTFPATMPTVLLLSRTGKLAKLYNPLTDEELESFDALVEELLNEKVP